MTAPRLLLTCCLCRKPLPQRGDVNALDAEWQRRYPQMVGTLACDRCASGNAYFFRCRTGRDDAYVPGHLPPRGQEEGHCFDSWHHVEAHGTPIAMAYSYPWSAVQQGAEDWLRHVVQRPQLDPEVGARIQDALHRWDTRPGAPDQSPADGTTTDAMTKVTVRGLTMTCWKCQRPTTVVVGLHLASAVNGDLVTCADEQVLAVAAELLAATGNVGLTRPIKQRSSRTAGTTGLTNGCQHCDALQGNFFIYHEELMEVLSANGVDGLDHLTDADLPTHRWQQLHRRWATGEP